MGDMLEMPGTQDASAVVISQRDDTAGAPDLGGLTIGPFVLEHVCGRGGTSVVVAARDVRDDSRAAVKILRGAFLADLARARRFVASAEALASLDHPAIVRHLAHGTTPRGEPYVAMEWLEGEGLADTLARRWLRVSEVITLGVRVAEGLAHAHAAGLVHHDIHPRSVFLRDGDAARVAILGFAPALVDEADPERPSAASIVGSAAYVAPERVRGATGSDARADLYALGALLFECLAQRPPFIGHNFMAILAQALGQAPPRVATLRPNVPEALDELIARLLSKDPAERPQRAADVAAALAGITVADDPSVDEPPRRRAEPTEAPVSATVVAEPRGAVDDAPTTVPAVPVTPPAPSAPASSGAEKPGERQLVAGRYEILGLLGVGGMGSVYRARDIQLDEEVALKLLRRELIDAPGALARFRQEVRLARKVTHRNVARTFDIGDHEGGLLLTMELLEGESLATRLERDGAMTINAALDTAMDLAKGLGAAHAAGVIHRDLKPDNVVITRDGRAVITDFGIARTYGGGEALRTGGLIGTPAYMAPEQVECVVEIDARADLYALGEILYEMLTGARAWPASSALVAATARLISPPPDPRALRGSVPEEIAAVVTRLLARARDDRFARVEDVAAALEAAKDRPRAPAAITEPTAPARYAAASARGDKTVAVLPIKNLGAPDYVVDGILEDLVDTLSMTRGLRVRPSGVTLRYKQSSLDAREIGRELGVSAVVEASIRAVGSEIRLTVRVLGVEDGYQLWAQRFQRPAAEILEVSDEAARAIAEALMADLEAPARGPAGAPIAADSYLRARAELRAAWHANVRIERVAELFDAAVGHAPRDPHVLAGAALAHARVSYFRGATWSEHAETARDLAERAIALAPLLAEPWIAIATLRVDGGDGVGAARALHSALRVAPKSAKAREMLGRLLLEAAEVDEAIALLASALDLDPSNEEPRWDLVRAYALRGDFARAADLLARPVETEAASVMRAYVGARVALWQPRGEARVPQGEPAGSGIVVSVVALLHQVLRTRTVSAKETAFLDEYAAGTVSRIGPLARQTLAEVHLALDAPNLDRARDLVRDAIDRGLGDVSWMDGCPLLAPLRAEAGWAALRARVDERAGRVRAAARDPSV